MYPWMVKGGLISVSVDYLGGNYGAEQRSVIVLMCESESIKYIFSSYCVSVNYLCGNNIA